MKTTLPLFVVLASVSIVAAVTVSECRMRGRRAVRVLARTEFKGLYCRVEDAVDAVREGLCTEQTICADPVTATMCTAKVTRKTRKLLAASFCSEVTPAPTQSMSPSDEPMESTSSNPSSTPAPPAVETPTPGPCVPDGDLIKAVNFGTLDIEGFELYEPTNLSTSVNTFGPRGILPEVYQEHIWKDGNFRYRVVELPAGRYRVVLHFAELLVSLCSEGARVFDVRVAGSQIIRDIDVFAAAGCRKAYTIETEIETSIRGATVRVIKGSANNGMIAGIQFFAC